ncbi:MAG: PEP-utilizing enzyme, partial [Patescibacteria group bacterium]|nr:PEP-utilizing enzyme [Patescibacteria group bacterium]
ADRPDLILRAVLELARSQNAGHGAGRKPGQHTAEALAQRLLAAVGPDRREEALETLQLGRLSWRLRDNDNLLLARVESQLIRALNVAAERLRAAGRLSPEAQVETEHATQIVAALHNPDGGKVAPVQKALPKQAPKRTDPRETPRQLIGQPAAPGVQAGQVHCIRGSEDLGRFRAGQVLVCDAIQPMMTHLVPLAAAIVERRGGMLIHGAIIARELGIPCVNGIAGAVDLLNDGDLVTVDGYLGIVTVGPPEFDLELAERVSLGGI